MKIQSNDLSWKQKGMSYRARLLARLGFITACVSLLCPGLPFLYILPTPSRKTGIFWDDTFPIIYTFGILGIAIFAIIKLRSAWNAPVNFMPSYASIPPDTLGKPFEVWYQETGLSSPFGKGTLDFQEQELVLEGNLFKGSLYSLLSPWKGAKVSAKTPYSNIASVSVEGR